jgi:hypothetical protein
MRAGVKLRTFTRARSRASLRRFLQAERGKTVRD